jgi:hypothetical protein
LLPLADAAASFWALFPRSYNRLPTDDSSQGLSVDRCATMTFATSAPC